MLGSLMMLASGRIASWPSSASSSLIRCAGVSFSGKLARMRPVSDMSFSFIFTPAVPTNASTIGSRENVASAGASSVFVQTISRSDMLAPVRGPVSAEFDYPPSRRALSHRRAGRASGGGPARLAGSMARRPAIERLRMLPRMFRRRIDHLADFGDLAGGNAADLGVLLNDRLILREINAKRLVRRDETFQPLDVGPELAQRFVGLRRRAAELFALQRADRGDVPFDDEFAQCHDFLPDDNPHENCPCIDLPSVSICPVYQFATKHRV